MASSTRTADADDNGQMGLAVPSQLSDHMLSVLSAAGINPATVSVPNAEYYSKIDWPELCTFNTRDKKTKASPVLLVRELDWQPEAEQRYKDYRGLVLVKFTTEFGDDLYVTHAMTYAATGEYLPLSAWLKQVKLPCLARFGRIETSRGEQFIIRPLPHDIEVV